MHAHNSSFRVEIYNLDWLRIHRVLRLHTSSITQNRVNYNFIYHCETQKKKANTHQARKNKTNNIFYSVYLGQIAIISNFAFQFVNIHKLLFPEEAVATYD